MKKCTLCLLFSAALVLGVTACTPTTLEVPPYNIEEGPAPTILDGMNLLPGEEAYIEDSMRETVDISATQGDVTLHILETVGDGKYLYVLYTLSVPGHLGEDATTYDIYKIERDLHVSFNEACSGAIGMFRYDPNTQLLYYCAEFKFSTPYTGRELTCELSTRAGSPFDESFSLTWAPGNTAPSVTAEHENGTCTLTPLLLDMDLTVDAPLDMADWTDSETLPLIGDVTIHYKDGSSVKGVRCGDYDYEPIYLHSAAPNHHTLFHLSDLESVTLYDTTFIFPDE